MGGRVGRPKGFSRDFSRESAGMKRRAGRALPKLQCEKKAVKRSERKTVHSLAHPHRSFGFLTRCFGSAASLRHGTDILCISGQSGCARATGIPHLCVAPFSMSPAPSHQPAYQTRVVHNRAAVVRTKNNWSGHQTRSSRFPWTSGPPAPNRCDWRTITPRHVPGWPRLS